MSKIPIYCSFDLLLKIFDEYNQQQIEVSEADDLILITSLYLFLTRSGKLFLDEDSEKVIQLANNNPYLKNLLKKSSIDSYTQIEYNRFEIEDIEEISKEVHPNTFFLLDTDEVHCQLLKKVYHFYLLGHYLIL
jgi:ABC-type oligopeptide transport system ATPase subunit